MRFNRDIVRFDMGGIPVAADTGTGTIVGLTAEGAALADALAVRDVSREEVSDSCAELVAYLDGRGFFDEPRQPRLASAYVHVTNRCNLSCIGCYSNDAGRNRDADPALASLERALDVLARLGVTRLVVSGGEPFLRDDLADIARAARRAGMDSVSVLTNGILCTPDRVEPLAGLVDTVAVSFDGTGRAARAHLRGDQRFEALVKAVATVRDAGIAARILPTVHARNVGDIPDYLRLGRELGASVGFSLLSGSPEVLGDLMPDRTCLTGLAEVLASAGLSAHDADAEPSARRALAACRSCGAGRTGVSVAADGSLYPCHMLHMSPFRLADIFHDPIEDISCALSAFDLPAVDALGTCSACGKRYLCGGGCRARAYLATGRVDGMDPYCAYYDRALDIAVDAVASTCPTGKED